MGGRFLFRLLAGLSLVAGVGGGAWLAPGVAAAESITLDAAPVPLSAEEPDRDTVGRLRYRGGLHLRADDGRFGGLSALGISADGQRLVALSDAGHRFSARLVYDRAGNLAGLRDADLGSLAGLDGRPLSSKSDGDAESMTPGVEGEIIVAFERRHRLWRYRPGITVPEPLPEPAEMSNLPFNKGVEALALLADGSLLALSEGNRERDAVLGWISDSSGWSVLTYRAADGFRVTGAATHPGGDVLVLERLFTLRGQNAIRLKRIPAAAIKAGALLYGETIAELRPPLTMDNFEGIEARRGPRGEVLVYLVSDDNFNAEQRTLLMMFELLE
ncbi:MAG: esterase-like activity of phytase family protein [Rhodospirillales bacterium]|nr:esterase-like activity of phytase family protein [Rhodospirillales bacterium]